VEALHDAGLFRLLVPSVFGGGEVPARTAFDDVMLRGDSARAIARLDAAVRAHPLTPASPPGAMLDVATYYAAAGVPERGRAILAQYDAAAHDSVERQVWRGQRVFAEAAILLAEGRPDQAIRAYRRMDVDTDGLPINCPFCQPYGLALAYDRANQTDSTIANIERYLRTNSQFRINADSWILGPFYKRLGELYEEKGDRSRAATAFSRLVRLWDRADPDLQGVVAEARPRAEFPPPPR